jgi:hypothetical protein
MVLSELLLHGQYQSFVVCKMGDCLLRRNREFLEETSTFGLQQRQNLLYPDRRTMRLGIGMG